MKNGELRHCDVRIKEAVEMVCYIKLLTCNLACIQGIHMQFNIQCTRIYISIHILYTYQVPILFYILGMKSLVASTAPPSGSE